MKKRLSKARLILDKAISRVLEINKQLKESATTANTMLRDNLKAELELLNNIIEQQAGLVKVYEMQLQQL
ncbi:MAG: hypothetical protein AAGI23_13385 [Bacteroidota bacterium]